MVLQVESSASSHQILLFKVFSFLMHSIAMSFPSKRWLTFGKLWSTQSFSNSLAKQSWGTCNMETQEPKVPHKVNHFSICLEIGLRAKLANNDNFSRWGNHWMSIAVIKICSNSVRFSGCVKNSLLFVTIFGHSIFTFVKKEETCKMVSSNDWKSKSF